MGWEYFNSLPGDKARPWEWAQFMTSSVRNGLPAISAAVPPLPSNKQNPFLMADITNAKAEEDAPLPKAFDYHSDENGED